MNIGSFTAAETSADRTAPGNWRAAPYCRWAFHNVRRLLPTAEVKNHPDAAVAGIIDDIDPCSLGFHASPGDANSLQRFMTEADCDGLVVQIDGRRSLERYPRAMTYDDPHILMAVSASLLGLIAGEFFDDRELTRPDGSWSA